jgi:hypothetical protein
MLYNGQLLLNMLKSVSVILEHRRKWVMQTSQNIFHYIIYSIMCIFPLALDKYNGPNMKKTCANRIEFSR